MNDVEENAAGNIHHLELFEKSNKSRKNNGLFSNFFCFFSGKEGAEFQNELENSE